MGQDVSLNRLEVQQPNLLMTLMREDTTQQHKPLHETVKGIVKGIQVNRIDVNAAELRYRKSTGSGADLFTIRQFDLTVDDFRLDSQSYQAQDRAYYANNIVVAATKVSYLFPDGTYRLTTDSLYKH